MDAPGASRRAEFQLRATFDEVSRVSAELRVLLPERLPRDERHGIEIAIAEALTNVVKHGYRGRDGAITVYWREGSRDLKVEIRDEGAPLDAHRLAMAGPETFSFDETDLQALPESGMGLALIKMAFDEVDYQIERGRNRLRLVKYIA